MLTTHSASDSTEDITPTLGFANGSARMSGCDVTLLDLGGNSRIRDIWDNYYAEVSACMGEICQLVHRGRPVSQYAKDTVQCSTSQLQLLMCGRSVSRRKYCILCIKYYITLYIVY